MRIFEYSDYKQFVNDWVHSQPKRGHGKFREIANAIRSSPTIVSQVFKGDRQLTLEQAALLCKYLVFSETESEYFLMLVLHERSGTQELRQIAKRSLVRSQKKAKDIKNRVSVDTTLPESIKATFYSHWYYSGARNLVAVPGYQSVERIAERLQLPKDVVGEVLRFLLATGLCVEESGQLKVGPAKTHLGASSPLAARHHTNWRLRAFEKYPRLSEPGVVYTSPMSLSQADAAKVRQEIVSLIERANRIMTDSPSETAMCLNIDWFEY